jgi:hypothetical protein
MKYQNMAPPEKMKISLSFDEAKEVSLAWMKHVLENWQHYYPKEQPK